VSDLGRPRGFWAVVSRHLAMAAHSTAGPFITALVPAGLSLPAGAEVSWFEAAAAQQRRVTP